MRAPKWRFFNAKNASDAELFLSANGYGVAGCLAGGCEKDRGWSTLSLVQHDERRSSEGTTPEYWTPAHAGAASTEADLDQLGCIVAQDAGALLLCGHLLRLASLLWSGIYLSLTAMKISPPSFLVARASLQCWRLPSVVAPIS